MKDLRCMVGLHDYVKASSTAARPPLGRGWIPVECRRCHKERSMRIPGAGPSGPIGGIEGGGLTGG